VRLLNYTGRGTRHAGGLLELAAALLLIGACSPSATFDKAERADDIETYKKFIEDNPVDTHVPSALRRIAELEYQEAVKAGTILAYKRFLTQFPESPQAEAAKKYLSELRFKKAAEENTRQAYVNFLGIYPDGPLSLKARDALMELDFATLAAGDIPAMRRFLAFYPGSPHRDEITIRLDDSEFEAARKEGEAGLNDYLSRRKGAPHSVEAKGLLLTGMMERAASRCSLKKAGRILDEMQSEPGLKSLYATYSGRLEVFRKGCRDRKMLLTLEKRELTSLSGSPSAYADAAARALALMNSKPDEFKKLKGLTSAVLSNKDIESVKALVKSAASSNPEERFRAARMLGFKPYGRALDALMELLGDYFLDVREAAYSSVSGVFREMDPAPRDKIFTDRTSRYERGPQDASVFLKLGALYEAMGMRQDALRYIRKSAMTDRFDPYLQYRLAVAEASWGEPSRARAAAVEFLKQSAGLMEERRDWLSGAKGSGVEGKFTAFQYCSLMWMTDRVFETLRNEGASDGKNADAEARDVAAVVGDRLARAKVILGRTQYLSRLKDEGSCGGDAGIPKVTSERAFRKETLLALDAVEPPWLEALLEQVSNRDPEIEIRKLAAGRLNAIKPAAKKGDRK
jgi:tetratricopeptide (TPR) repeat protein